MYSRGNIWKGDDIVSLASLRRIYSWNDKYHRDNSFLLCDLFNRKELEYVYVRNVVSGSNVVGSIIIPGNVQSLRYMYVHHSKGVYDIKLDVS